MFGVPSNVPWDPYQGSPGAGAEADYTFGDYINAGRFSAGAMNPRGQSWDPGMYAGYGQPTFPGALNLGVGVLGALVNGGIGYWLWRVAKREKGASKAGMYLFSGAAWIKAGLALTGGTLGALLPQSQPALPPGPLPAGPVM